MQFRVVLTGEDSYPPNYMSDMYSYFLKKEDMLADFLQHEANIVIDDYSLLEFRQTDPILQIRFKALSSLYKNTRDVLLCDSIVFAFWKMMQIDYQLLPRIQCIPEMVSVDPSSCCCCGRGHKT